MHRLILILGLVLSVCAISLYKSEQTPEYNVADDLNLTEIDRTTILENLFEFTQYLVILYNDNKYDIIQTKQPKNNTGRYVSIDNVKQFVQRYIDNLTYNTPITKYVYESDYYVNTVYVFSMIRNIILIAFVFTVIILSILFIWSIQICANMIRL